MLSRFKRSWYLFQSSLYVLNKDRELLIFPMISGILTISVVASFIVPFIWAASSGGEYNFISTTWLSYVMIFLFYLLSYFITYFFNTAIISCAIYRMKGGDPDLRGGLRAAFARIREIFGWALVSATVGIFLKHVQNNSNLVGKLVAAVAGIAWSVASYLVIPIIVMERLGPIDALKESSKLVKKTWGEQVIGNIGFGAFFILILLPMFVIIPMLTLTDNVVWYLIGITVMVIYVTLVALVHSTLLAIFQSALYLYAREDFVPEGYDRSLLRESVSKD